MGSGSVDGQSVRANLLSLHSRWLMVSIGLDPLASTFCLKYLFHELNPLIFHGGQVQYFQSHLYLPGIHCE